MYRTDTFRVISSQQETEILKIEEVGDHYV